MKLYVNHSYSMQQVLVLSGSCLLTLVLFCQAFDLLFVVLEPILLSGHSFSNAYSVDLFRIKVCLVSPIVTSVLAMTATYKHLRERDLPLSYLAVLLLAAGSILGIVFVVPFLIGHIDLLEEDSFRRFRRGRSHPI